jgi:hypothetical protein
MPERGVKDSRARGLKVQGIRDKVQGKPYTACLLGGLPPAALP